MHYLRGVSLGDRSGDDDGTYTWSNWAMFSCWAGSGAAIVNEPASEMSTINAVNIVWIIV